MMKQILIAAFVAVGVTGLAGSAAAIAPGSCQYGASPLGYYSVCLLYKYSDPYYSFKEPAYGYFSTPAGTVYGGAYQGAYNYPGCCSGSFTSAYSGVYGPVGGASLGAYQSGYSYSGFSGKFTEVYVGAGPAYGYLVQSSTTPGGCTMSLGTPFGFQSQPCGAIPVFPDAPQIPL
ncbi:MAG: hypothetical protein LC624_00095 [Halobacteriales archaeon]|nr:hypothetical protein [Halobacteriales archaeon]